MLAFRSDLDLWARDADHEIVVARELVTPGMILLALSFSAAMTLSCSDSERPTEHGRLSPFCARLSATGMAIGSFERCAGDRWIGCQSGRL